MLKVSSERRRREARPGIRVSSKTVFLMSSEKVEAGDLCDRPKHRRSCSTVEEDFAAATVMDGSALPAIDALPSCDAISETPRAAGYRGSDFVRWHIAEEAGSRLGTSAIRGTADQQVRQCTLRPAWHA